MAAFEAVQVGFLSCFATPLRNILAAIVETYRFGCSFYCKKISCPHRIVNHRLRNYAALRAKVNHCSAQR